jgi:hypothetical protein
MCEQWCRNDRADTCAATLVTDLQATVGIAAVRAPAELAAAGELPPWLGDADLHRSHQSALVRKDPAHYRPFFPGVPDDMPYVWPASDRARRVPV